MSVKLRKETLTTHVTLDTLPEAKEVEASKVRMTVGLRAAAADGLMRGIHHPYTEHVIGKQTSFDSQWLGTGFSKFGDDGRGLAKKTVDHLVETGKQSIVLAIAAEELDMMKRTPLEQRKADNPNRALVGMIPTTQDSKIMLSNEDIAILDNVLKRRDKFMEG